MWWLYEVNLNRGLALDALVIYAVISMDCRLRSSTDG